MSVTEALPVHQIARRDKTFLLIHDIIAHVMENIIYFITPSRYMKRHIQQVFQQTEFLMCPPVAEPAAPSNPLHSRERTLPNLFFYRIVWFDSL